MLTFKLTKMDTDGLGAAPNAAEYHGRGWCFCESSVSDLMKGSGAVLDLGKLRAGTPASVRAGERRLEQLCREASSEQNVPLLPARFREALASKAFADRADDEVIVAGLYEDTFMELMGAATDLSYHGLWWGDAEVSQLCEVLESGVLSSLTVLDLTDNKISDAGVAALASAVASGAMPRLEAVLLEENPCDHSESSPVASALAGHAGARQAKRERIAAEIGLDIERISAVIGMDIADLTDEEAAKLVAELAA